MGLFLLKRLGVALLTALVLTFVVFWLTNLPPRLETLAKTEANNRMSDAEVTSWLEKRGYTQPLFTKYGQWLGVLPGFRTTWPDGSEYGQCLEGSAADEDPRRFCGILQGKWGQSTVFGEGVSDILAKRLALTGKLMFWAFALMVPAALIIGVLAGMREGSKLDRSLSTVSIISTATPEYVSGVVFIAVFASSAFGLKWLKGSATSAMENANIDNFLLPVLTIALYGMGYIARMTRASMAEVMTAQYIRTAHLKGVSFGATVLRHALRNALIAPFTVIMLQIPWLLGGVVIVETLFNYKGFGWTMYQAASNNDVSLLLGVSVVSVFVVLATQLISDIGYVYLNPRIRIA